MPQVITMTDMDYLPNISFSLAGSSEKDLPVGKELSSDDAGLIVPSAGGGGGGGGSERGSKKSDASPRAGTPLVSS